MTCNYTGVIVVLFIETCATAPEIASALDIKSQIGGLVRKSVKKYCSQFTVHHVPRLVVTGSDLRQHARTWKNDIERISAAAWT